jgi:hypothetical protein
VSERFPVCKAQQVIRVLRVRRMKGASGMSDIEGKVTRVGVSEGGQRVNFNYEVEADLPFG